MLKTLLTGGSIFKFKIIRLLNKDLYKVAATDGLMYILSYVPVFFQLGVKHGYLNWYTSGWIIQNVSLIYYSLLPLQC